MTAVGGIGGVHHRKSVGSEFLDPVGVSTLRTVRLAVSPPVEGDDLRVAREVRDLHLPHARVHGRPRRHQKNCRFTLPAHLVVDPHPVARHEPLAVGVPGTRLLRCPVPDCFRRFTEAQGRASKTMLKGVSATRLNRLNPALVTMSRMRASPA